MRTREKINRVVSLNEARALGLKYYFTGIPCKHGHLSERTVSESKCLDCGRDRKRKRRAQNPEHEVRILSAWRARNPDYFRQRYAVNPEARRESTRRWKRNNPEASRASQRRTDANPRRKKAQALRARLRFAFNPERVLANNRAWGLRNRAHKVALNALRHAAKLQRTPSWADKKAIVAFYRNRPAGYHVDHIVPLQGELVSGLHVLGNLQYLPARENMAKKNLWQSA